MLSEQPLYRRRTVVERVVGAVLAIAIASILSLVFRALIARVVFIFFFAALAFTSWFSGFVAALVVIVYGIVFVNYYLVAPYGTITINVGTVFITVTFASVALFFSWLSNKMRFAADIATERAKLLEEQAMKLEEQAMELEEQSAELESQVEYAEAASAAKNQFMAVMSHELRTPLNAIIGYTDLLHSEVSGTLNDVQKTQLERIRASSGHLLDLIQDVLSFSRIEAGRETLRISDVDAVEITQESVAYVERAAAAKQIAVRTDLPHHHVIIVTDPSKLKQILLNLLSNAVKFTDHGEVGIKVRTAHGDMFFEVWDTGPGIDDDHLGIIFEPFTQVDGSNTRQKGGIGLGLPVSRRLAHLLGGTLTVTSARGKGSRFMLRLPMQLRMTGDADDAAD